MPTSCSLAFFWFACFACTSAVRLKRREKIISNASESEVEQGTHCARGLTDLWYSVCEHDNSKLTEDGVQECIAGVIGSLYRRSYFCIENYKTYTVRDLKDRLKSITALELDQNEEILVGLEAKERKVLGGEDDTLLKDRMPNAWTTTWKISIYLKGDRLALVPLKIFVRYLEGPKKNDQEPEVIDIDLPGDRAIGEVKMAVVEAWKKNGFLKPWDWENERFLMQGDVCFPGTLTEGATIDAVRVNERVLLHAFREPATLVLPQEDQDGRKSVYLEVLAYDKTKRLYPPVDDKWMSTFDEHLLLNGVVGALQGSAIAAFILMR